MELLYLYEHSTLVDHFSFTKRVLFQKCWKTDLLKPHVPPLTLSGDISVELLKRVSKRWLVCLLLSGGGASGEIIYETHVV